MFSNLLRYDLKRGILCRLFVFLPTFLLGLLGAVYFFLVWGQHEMGLSQALEPPTVGDAVFYLLSGTLPYTLSETNRFVFPAMWIALYGYGGFVMLTYLSHDLEGVGWQFLARCHSRHLWWTSKCICTILGNILNSTIWLLTIILCVTAAGGVLSLDVSDSTYQLSWMFRVNQMIGGPSELASAILLAQLIMIVLSLAIQLICLYLKPVLAYIAYLALLIVSAYLETPLLLPNYLMLLRNGGLFKGTLSVVTGYGLTLATMLLVMALGHILFRRYDVLNRGRELI